MVVCCGADPSNYIMHRCLVWRYALVIHEPAGGLRVHGSGLQRALAGRDEGAPAAAGGAGPSCSAAHGDMPDGVAVGGGARGVVATGPPRGGNSSCLVRLHLSGLAADVPRRCQRAGSIGLQTSI